VLEDKGSLVISVRLKPEKTPVTSFGIDIIHLKNRGILQDKQLYYTSRRPDKSLNKLVTILAEKKQCPWTKSEVYPCRKLISRGECKARFIINL
jgi:hypothetical protein